MRFFWGACCGCRRSEICGLKYEDINEKKSTIQIRRTIVKDEHGKWVVREKTKTVKSKRLIEVTPFIVQKLLALPRESDFVISRLPDTISKDFIDLRDELGIKCRFHDLRHPYVKHTTKKYNSEKQKTQATKMDLIAWVFRFYTFNYSKRSWIL